MRAQEEHAYESTAQSTHRRAHIGEHTLHIAVPGCALTASTASTATASGADWVPALAFLKTLDEITPSLQR